MQVLPDRSSPGTHKTKLGRSFLKGLLQKLAKQSFFLTRELSRKKATTTCVYKQVLLTVFSRVSALFDLGHEGIWFGNDDFSLQYFSFPRPNIPVTCQGQFAITENSITLTQLARLVKTLSTLSQFLYKLSSLDKIGLYEVPEAKNIRQIPSWVTSIE